MILCLSVVVLPVVIAQQPQPRPRPVPTLTSEDLLTTQPKVTPPPETDKAPKDNPKTSGPDVVGAVKEQKTKPAPSPEEKERQASEREWNEKFKKAEERLKDLERRADEGELEIGRLRNLQFSPTPQEAGTGAQINARIAELAKQVSSLRDEAKTAQAEVDALKQEGEAKKYREDAGSPKKEDGSPNAEYYSSRYAELQRDLSDAESRIQVIQLRINDLNTRIRKNTGGVDAKGNSTNSSDAFAIRRLRAALQEEQERMDEARKKAEDATRKIDELRREAAGAGIPVGEAK